MSTEAAEKMRRKSSIPSSNHWRYLLNFQQVHESVRVSKEGVATYAADPLIAFDCSKLIIRRMMAYMPRMVTESDKVLI